MAESFPSTIAVNILREIDFLTSSDSGLSSRVRKEIMKAKEILLKGKGILMKAEAQQLHNRELQDGLDRLADLLYDADDLLDELKCEVLAKQVGGLNTVKYYLKIKATRKSLDEMVDNIQSISIADKNPDAKLVYPGENVMNHPLVGTPLVFGRDNDKEKIINLLMKPNKENERVSVIPIVGLGGIGKTTLAKLVYDDKRIDEHFNLKMWVSVPEDFDMIKLMKEAYTSATGENHADLGVVKLEDCLLQELAGKKFLLVLDDVWNENYDRWDKLKQLFTQEANGSKILVTTRSSQVASIMGPDDSYPLDGPSPDDCMFLFEKFAFGDETDKADSNFTQIGKEIVGKCGRVPLLLKTLGALLYKNTDTKEWILIRDNVKWEPEQDRENILSALKLSYAHLPSRLRRCLAYCSLFPRNSCFNSDYMICNWMAQGFLESPTENEDLEDVGLRYLKKLFSRCFIQDIEDHGYFFTFKMHNLIYDLVEKMAQRNYKTVDLRILHDDVNCRPLSFLGNARHLSFLGIGNGNKKVPSISNNLRTIIMQSLESDRVAESFVSKWISNFKCLRLLCLSGLKFKELPDSVAALKHLRFLNLSGNSHLEKLYDTLCKLLSLQTLKLRGCSALKNLPRNIQKMIRLRYLELTVKWERLPQSGAECFKSLQYLHLYKCENLGSLREGMKSLTTIRTLILQGCDILTSLPENVELLKSLEKLVISSCPKLNLKMDLKGEHCSLKLKVFMIYELKELEDLPQLILQGSANSLEYIRIEKCSKLTELPAWLEKLTALQKLEIVSCSGLSSLPDGMQKLTALQKLEIVSCSELSSLPAGMEKLTALRELKIQKSPRLGESCRQKPLKNPNLEIHLDPEGASSSRDKE